MANNNRAYRDGDYAVVHRFPNAILVIGESGAGKSSWIRHVTGVDVPVGGGNVAVTTACGMYECASLRAMLIDTRGYDDPNATNDQLTLDMLRFIRDNQLRICLVMIFVTRTMRESPFITGMVNWTAGLHPDMRSRLHFWIATDRINVAQARALVAPPIDATRRDFPYTFPAAEIAALMKAPLPAVWNHDRCAHCPLVGDRRLLADKACLRHLHGPHDVQFRPGTQTTRHFHAGPRVHRGHFQGWWHGDTYAGCKCNHRLDGCTCGDCGRGWSTPACRTEVTGSAGERFCTRCTNPTAATCANYCSVCGSTSNPPHHIPGAVHEWVRAP